MAIVFVGHDWAETHHDIYIEDQEGKRLGRARLLEGVAGVAQFQAMMADLVSDPSEVMIATETDRGLFMSALLSAGYAVVAINPMSTARYRERLSTSGAKSDPGDAKTLAAVARLDGHNHRRVCADTELADAIKVQARAHQSLIWTRQRQLNQLRSVLREFYPAALEAFPELAHGDCLAVLAVAPTPRQASRLSVARVAAALRRGGRKRGADARAAEIVAVLRSAQLAAAVVVADAMGSLVTALVAVASELTTQINRIERELEALFDSHDSARIIRSIPGLGTKLGARLLGEFGDAPDRFVDVKARRNYAGTSPVTKASGRSHVVLARHARNLRLADACYQWAFITITASPGARAFYDEKRAHGASHSKALRALSNRLVGILHGCLAHDTTYDENLAWAHRQPAAA
jgi:hypothetical protein